MRLTKIETLKVSFWSRVLANVRVGYLLTVEAGQNTHNMAGCSKETSNLGVILIPDMTTERMAVAK